LKRFLSILVTLGVLSLSLVTAVPAFAAATGNIADNDLGAQSVGMSQQICVQSVTISNSGAGSLLIDYVAITNTGTAGDTDVTQVALYFDTNGTHGSWDVSDTLVGSAAANFTGASAIGDVDDTPIISVGAGASANFFVVITTAAAPTDGSTFQTTIDASNLTSGTTDTWGDTGIATATSATTIDGTAPTVAITSTAPDPTNTSPIPITATFSESVNGFTVGDITVGNGSVTAFTPVSSTVYAFDVTPAGQGTVTVDIAAGVAQDAASNGNTAAPQFTITYDSAGPSVAITSTESSPTKTSPITMTATFSEDVTGFDIGDITVGNGTASNFAGGPAVYTFDVTPSSQGIITVDIAAGVAQDAAANGNTAAPQFTIVYSLTVGGTIYHVNKASAMIPWFGLAITLILAIGGSTLALIKRRTR
jgi:hypothetical protein